LTFEPRHPNSHTWHLVHLGLLPYAEAWDLQARLVEARAAESLPNDVVLVLEHPAVFTLGKRGGRENLLVSEDTLARHGIPIVQVERGGKITYHAPGQLVLYPIIHLQRAGIKVVDMVGRLEEVMIRTCADWGIQVGRNPLNRGVWVGLKKIGAIGIAVRRGVSFHGMALNVNIDLEPFCWIQPCGLEGVGVTSMRTERGLDLEMAEVRRVLTHHMQTVFSVRLVPTVLNHVILPEGLTLSRATD
jgi:lipoate-protein ligase B